MADLKGLTDDFKTEDSPQYGWRDARLYTAMGIAAVLMLATIGVMFMTANTVVAESVLWLYNVFWVLGIVVVGAVLTAGWYLGLYGIESENMFVGVFGVLLSVLAYGSFGGAILTMYDSSLYFNAILVTSVVSVGITLGLCVYIFTSERDLSNWMGYAGSLFVGGLLLAIVASFIEVLQVVVFGLFLLGFFFELGFEIWYCSRGGRTSVANGFAIYFAFAGIFVHILQIALQGESQ